MSLPPDAQAGLPPGPAGASAVTTTGGPDPSAGATTTSARPATVSTQATWRPSGENRGPARVRDRATMAGVTGAALIIPRRYPPGSPRLERDRWRYSPRR